MVGLSSDLICVLEFDLLNYVRSENAPANLKADDSGFSGVCWLVG